MTKLEKAFIDEIIRNHGTDSMQYVWAVATVNESICKRQRGGRK